MRVTGFTAILGALLFLRLCSLAQAQVEFPPPQGKGPVVVVVSGADGAGVYTPAAKRVAALGYDVLLLDGKDISGTDGDALQSAIEIAQASPHALPGKVGVVGFSLGGGEALMYASRWPDLVSVIVAWYPLTTPITDIPGFVSGIKVPMLMFAGESDTYMRCCLIATARKLSLAASVQGAPLRVITYPHAVHEFIFPDARYNAAATADSWRRAQAELAQYLGH
jgi:dienelactone hydrolase